MNYTNFFIIIFVPFVFARCASEPPKIEIINLEFSEQDLSIDRTLFISYSAIDKKNTRKGYRFIFRASSYGWDVSAEKKITKERLDKVLEIIVDGGGLYLPDIDFFVSDTGVHRKLHGTINDSGELREFSIQFFGPNRIYDIKNESNDWKYWAKMSKENKLKPGDVPDYVYERLFQQFLNEAFLYVPKRTIEEFCRLGP